MTWKKWGMFERLTVFYLGLGDSSRNIYLTCASPSRPSNHLQTNRIRLLVQMVHIFYPFVRVPTFGRCLHHSPPLEIGVLDSMRTVRSMSFLWAEPPIRRKKRGHCLPIKVCALNRRIRILQCQILQIPVPWTCSFWRISEYPSMCL